MSWKQRKLGELIEHFSVRAKDYGGSEGLEFLGVSNESGITSSKYAAEEKAEDYKIIEKGCFAYNPYRINVGSIGYLKEDIKGLFSPAYVVFKAKEDQIIPELLLKFLKSDEGLHQIRINARGTVRQALRFEDLSNIDISLPDIEEQKTFFNRILKIEEKSLPLANELKYQLELIKKLRQSFIKEAIQGKLVEQDPNEEPASVLLKSIKSQKNQWIKDKVIKKPKSIPPILDFEIKFDIPRTWTWCRLGEFAYVTSGSTPKSSEFITEGIPFLKMYNLREQRIDFDFKKQFIKESVHNGSLKRCRAFPGDLIMNIVGPPLGKLAIIPESLPECNFNQAAVLIRPTILEINKYLFWYLSEMSEINEIETKGVAGQNNISVTQAHNMKIPLPPLSEQKRIVARLNVLMHICDEVEASINESKMQNESLLQQTLREALGLKSSDKQVKILKPLKSKGADSKFDSNTLLMEIQELLKIHGKLQALELWQMSKFYGKTDEDKNIDGFYTDLKKLIEKDKVVKETEKGYLELV